MWEIVRASNVDVTDEEKAYKVDSCMGTFG
jgi:hypothetical protein